MIDSVKHRSGAARPPPRTFLSANAKCYLMAQEIWPHRSRESAYMAMIGQEHESILQRLAHARTRGRLGHALLLTGGGGHGAYALAVRVAQMLLCPGHESADECPVCRRVRNFDHPDLSVVAPLPPVSQRAAAMKDGIDPVTQSLKEDPYAPLEVGANWGITADQARDLIRWVSLAPWQAAHKVAVLAEADKVTEPTADILLKTLEEPPENVTMLLVTSRPQDLLSTVRSRCQEVNVPPFGDDDLLRMLAEHGVEPEEASGVLGPANGSLWEALVLLQDEAGRMRTIAGELVLAALNPKLGTSEVIGAVRQAVSGMSTAESSELVRWIVWWIRDLVLANEKVLPLRPDMEQVAPMAAKVGTERMTQWSDEADTAFEMLRRNVTPPAVVTALVIYPRDQRRLGEHSTFPPLHPALPR